MAKYSQVLTTEAAISTGSTFTSPWEYVADYESLIVYVKTDQNGLFTVQFSHDGVNADSTLTRYYTINSIEAPHRYTITRPFARITFTNDSGTDQTYIRMGCMLGNYTALNVPLDGTVARDYDAEPTRPSSFHHEVVRGLRQGCSIWNKFGYNADIDIASSPEVIAAFGGNYTPPTTAYTLSIVSSAAADDDGSTGAENVYVYGVDANRMSIVEQVTLNGTSAVTSTNTFLGINRVAVGSAGSGQVNAGTITVTHSTGGQVLATLPAGEGTTQQAIYHNETDHICCMEELMVSAVKVGAGTSPEVTIKAWVWSPVSNAKYEVFRAEIDTGVENNLVLTPKIPFVLNSGDVIWFEGSTDKDDTSISVRFSLVDYADVDSDDL